MRLPVSAPETLRCVVDGQPAGGGAARGRPATAASRAAAAYVVRRRRTSRPPCPSSAATIASTCSEAASRITAEDPSGTSLRTSSKNALRSCGLDLSSATLPARPPPTIPAAKTRRTEHGAGNGAGERALDGLAPDELLLVVRVHVSARKLAANHDPVAAVMLGECDPLRRLDTCYLCRRV